MSNVKWQLSNVNCQKCSNRKWYILCFISKYCRFNFITSVIRQRLIKVAWGIFCMSWEDFMRVRYNKMKTSKIRTNLGRKWYLSQIPVNLTLVYKDFCIEDSCMHTLIYCSIRNWTTYTLCVVCIRMYRKQKAFSIIHIMLIFVFVKRIIIW